MTSFNESDINRASDGRFASKSTSETSSDVLVSDIQEIDVDQINGRGFCVDAARIVTNGDGSCTLEVEKFVDDFEAVESRRWPGYCSERTELIEAYAEKQWGAQLDNAIGWDEDEIGHQRLTFSMPTEAHDEEDVAQQLQSSILDRQEGTFGAYHAESRADNMSTLSNMQDKLDEADHRSSDVTGYYFKLNRDAGYPVSMSTQQWSQVQNEFRSELARGVRNGGLDTLADEEHPREFARKVFSRHTRRQLAVSPAIVDPIDSPTREVWGRDSMTGNWYQRVDDETKNALYEARTNRRKDA